MSAGDRRSRVIWACPALTLAQKALWDLIRRLESPSRGDGAFGTAAYLAECLGLAQSTVMKDRAALHRAGLLDARQPHGRRQGAHWFALLASDYQPADPAHRTIMDCAHRLATHLGTLPEFTPRPNSGVTSETYLQSQVSTPDPRPNSGVRSSTGDGMGESLIPSPIPSSPPNGDEGWDGGTEAAQRVAVRTDDAAPDEGDEGAAPAFTLRQLEDQLSLPALRRLLADAEAKRETARIEKLRALIRGGGLQAAAPTGTAAVDPRAAASSEAVA